MFPKSIAVVTGVVLCFVAELAAQESDANHSKEIEKLFADITPQNPGCAVGVRRDGRLILKRGFGAASVAFDAANDSATAFEIASGSKSFTAVCIALLMDQGKVKPDDDVRTILPELQLNQPVRIRHLLRCESGVWAQFHIMPLAGWDNVPVHSPYSKEDFFTVLCGQKNLPFEPGSQFQYGSGDTFLLGMVVERVSGRSLAEFAKDNLFEPLGMTRTWYLEDPAMVVKNRAVGHWKSDATWASGDLSPVTEWRHWNATAFLGGGGSLVTCVDDMLKWTRIYQKRLLPRGKYIDEFTSEGTVLGNRFVLDVDAYMKRVNQHPENPPAGFYRGAKRIQTTGGYWGFTCCVSHFPEHDTTIICLSNSDSVSAIGKSRKIADIVLADVLGPKPKAALVNDETSVQLTSQQLRKFEGFWRQKGNNPIAQTSLVEGTIQLAIGYGKPTTLRPIGNNRFRPDSGFYKSAVFEFATDSTGEYSKMTLSSCENGFHEIVPHFRVERANPQPESLQDYSGAYVSSELGAIYRFRVKDEQLQVRVGSRRWESMRPLEQDEFSPIVNDPHNKRFIRFSRNENGQVDGFSIGFWRIHGVRFDRFLSEK